MSFSGDFNPLYSLSGLLVGFLVGQTGMGGGALMTPLLVLVFGVHPVSAVGTDLLYAAITKTAGTLVHGANKSVDWRIVRRLATGSLPATVATLLVINYFGLGGPGHGQAEIITRVLGVMLILTAASLPVRLFLLAYLPQIAALPRLAEPEAARRAGRLTVITGLVLGVLVTISSVGAGAIGVMVLMMLYPRTRMATIVGSDIAHAVPLTLLAGIGHWWMGSVDSMMLVSLLAGSIPGVMIGSRLSLLLPEMVMRWMLAVMLAIVGGVLMF